MSPELVLSTILMVAMAPIGDQESYEVPVALVGGHVLRPAGNGFDKERCVVLRGGRIVFVGPEEDAPSYQGFIRKIDLAGLYLIPGLVDAHGCIDGTCVAGEAASLDRPRSLLRYIPFLRSAVEQGVTSIRLCHHSHADVMAVRAAREQGWLWGPRILATYPTNGEADASDAWEWSSLRVDGSREAGAGRLVLDAVRRGKNAVVRCHDDAAIALASQLGAQAIECAHEPSVDALGVMSAHRASLWPMREQRAAAEGPGLASPTAFARLVEHSRHTGVRLGIPLGICGYEPQKRTVPDDLVRFGMSPLEVLRSITVDPAISLGRSDIGVISEGAAADLVVVGANPPEDVGALRDVYATIIDGDVVYGMRLEGQLSFVREGTIGQAERQAVAICDRFSQSMTNRDWPALSSCFARDSVVIDPQDVKWDAAEYVGLVGLGSRFAGFRHMFLVHAVHSSGESVVVTSIERMNTGIGGRVQEYDTTIHLTSADGSWRIASLVRRSRVPVRWPCGVGKE